LISAASALAKTHFISPSSPSTNSPTDQFFSDCVNIHRAGVFLNVIATLVKWGGHMNISSRHTPVRFCVRELCQDVFYLLREKDGMRN
jgi:hypothetical protein